MILHIYINLFRTYTRTVFINYHLPPIMPSLWFFFILGRRRSRIRDDIKHTNGERRQHDSFRPQMAGAALSRSANPTGWCLYACGQVTEPRDPSCAWRFVVRMDSEGENELRVDCMELWWMGTSGFDEYAETDEAKSVETRISSFIDDLQ